MEQEQFEEYGAWSGLYLSGPLLSFCGHPEEALIIGAIKVKLEWDSMILLFFISSQKV